MASSKGKKELKKSGAKKPGTTAASATKPLPIRFTTASVKTDDSTKALPKKLSCRACVEAAIRSVCGPFSSISQTLNTICAPCNAGKLAQLEQAVSNCSGKSVTLTCSMTVRDVIVEVCD